ncbi:MAG: hypothetical protein NVS2B5_30610 [Beijerinckiaceae bacterium]
MKRPAKGGLRRGKLSAALVPHRSEPFRYTLSTPNAADFTLFVLGAQVESFLGMAEVSQEALAHRPDVIPSPPRSRVAMSIVTVIPTYQEWLY